MQFFDSSSWFGGYVFVNMICNVVLDSNVPLMSNLLPIVLKLSDIPAVYDIIAVPLGLFR